MTTPTVEGLLTQPYVSVAEFRAAPTWLDTDDLIPGGVQGQQDEELYNVLLRASAWADNFCELRLGAHTATEQTRARPDRNGLLYLTPSNIPVRSITGLAYGTSFQQMQTLTTPSTTTWVEDARGIIVSMFPFNANYLGSLQFGGAPSVDTEVFVQYQYVAGYANTTLATSATQGATSLTVTDPTGITPPVTGLVGTIAGSVARIWDPGEEEAITVASSYTTGSTTIPLQAPLVNGHAAGTMVSEFPSEIRQAVITHAVALLLREDVSEEAPFPGTPFGPSARRSASGGKAGGLIDHAMLLLEPYRRVR